MMGSFAALGLSAGSRKKGATRKRKPMKKVKFNKVQNQKIYHLVGGIAIGYLVWGR